jgi:thioredoxin 1
MIKHIETEKEFDEIIKSRNVVVDFYATWCAPCRALAPILEDIDIELKDIVIAKVDVDELSIVASRYGIMSIPTLLFFNNGTLVHEQIGLLPPAQLLALFKKHL